MASNNKHKKASPNKPLERITPEHIPWYYNRLRKEHTKRYEFAKKLVKNKIVIDVACGTGFGSLLLANAGAKKIVGIDNDANAISYGNEHYPLKKIIFIQADAQKIPLNNNFADVVISFETIEHLPNPKQFLLEINRLLKPNGILLLSTPNKETSYGDNPFHLKEYAFSDLRRELSNFTSISFYGQRPVNMKIFLVYKKIITWLKSPFLKLSFPPMGKNYNC